MASDPSTAPQASPDPRLDAVAGPTVPDQRARQHGETVFDALAEAGPGDVRSRERAVERAGAVVAGGSLALLALLLSVPAGGALAALLLLLAVGAGAYAVHLRRGGEPLVNPLGARFNGGAHSAWRLLTGRPATSSDPIVADLLQVRRRGSLRGREDHAPFLGSTGAPVPAAGEVVAAPWQRASLRAVRTGDGQPQPLWHLSQATLSATSTRLVFLTEAGSPSPVRARSLTLSPTGRATGLARRAGLAVAGHVRWAWVREVGFDAAGAGGRPQVHLLLGDAGGGTATVVTLDEVDGSAVSDGTAAELARLAAAERRVAVPDAWQVTTGRTVRVLPGAVTVPSSGATGAARGGQGSARAGAVLGELRTLALRNLRVTAVVVLVAVGALGSTVSGWLAGPTSDTELCEQYREYATQVVASMAVPSGFDNALFDAAGDLGSSAQRHDDAAVQSSGRQLEAIADATSTSMFELESAAATIAARCS